MPTAEKDFRPSRKVKGQLILISKARVLVGLLVIASVVVRSYFARSDFRFAGTTLIILIVASMTFGGAWPEWLGLRTSKRELGKCLLLAAISLTVGAYFIPVLTRLAGCSYVSWEAFSARISPAFQAFNEELVLRALLLGTLLRTFNRPRAVSTIAALSFASLHFGFYHYHPMGADLRPLVLVNLALFAFACNQFFLESGHIGYGVALHVGWNLYRFGGYYVRGGRPISEADAFNAIEGSPWNTLLIVTVFFSVRLFLLSPRSPRQPQSWPSRSP